MRQKVTYLLGSGATHGVVRHAENKSLLTSDIQDYIGGRLAADADPLLEDKIWTEIVKYDRDVEHLITVLDCQYKYETAVKAREYYCQAILELVGRLHNKYGPNLYTYLADLHLRSSLSKTEELVCFLSLNYEDILERSIETHLPNVLIDYGLDTEPAVVKNRSTRKIPVLKLHGSFNWENTRPISVTSLENMGAGQYPLWIPPGVDKKREHYPFNLLWGKAVEFIRGTDVLRVIGCSLSRNDWSLIPILYTAQSLSNNKPLRIELVDYTESVDRIVENYGYLTFTKFVDLDEIRNFKPTGSGRLTDIARAEYFSATNRGIRNIFDQWLKAKIEFTYTDNSGLMRDDKLKKSKALFAADYYINGK